MGSVERKEQEGLKLRHTIKSFTNGMFVVLVS